MMEWHKIHTTHTWVWITLPALRFFNLYNTSAFMKVTQLLVTSLLCIQMKDIHLQTPISAYNIPFHHCHQYSDESNHNGQRRGYTDHCCIGMLHFDRKLHEYIVREMSTGVWLQNLVNSRKHEKLTAVSLITSIRACPVSIAFWRGGDTLAIGAFKLGGITAYYVWHVCAEYRYVTCMLQPVISFPVD